MMMSSHGHIFCVAGPLCREFTGYRLPVNSPHKGQWRGALIFSLICALNIRLSKQSWVCWFEAQSHSLWRHCDGIIHFKPLLFLFSLLNGNQTLQHFCADPEMVVDVSLDSKRCLSWPHHPTRRRRTDNKGLGAGSLCRECWLPNGAHYSMILVCLALW